MKQILMTCMVDMPDDLFEGAAVSLKVKPAWESLLAALADAKVECSTKLDVIVLDQPRKKRGGPVKSPPAVLPIADEAAEP